MALMKWEPFEPFEKLFEKFPMIPFAPTIQMGSDFAVDLYEEKDRLIAEMNLPGVKPEEIEITFQNNNLHITLKKVEEKETKEKEYYYKEIKRGRFERLVTLPVEVKTEKTEAHYTNGVLKVVMPLKEFKKTEKVQIQIQ